MRPHQDVTLCTRIQDGTPRGDQRITKGKCLTSTETLATFCWNLWGPIRTSLFPPGARMRSQGTTKGTNKGNARTVEKPEQVFVEICGVLSGPHFSTRRQGGIPRDNQRNTKGKCLTGRKPLTSFCWNLWGPIRTPLFPPGSRMGSQETTNRTKKEMHDRQKNLITFLLKSMRSYQDLTFSTRIQDGIPRDNQRDTKRKVWQVEKPKQVFIANYELLSEPDFFHQEPGWGPKRQPKGQKKEMPDM